MSDISVGDRIAWRDDSKQLGTVLKTSAETRRDGLGEVRKDLPPMVLVQWDWSLYDRASGRKRWTAPELLVRVEKAEG